MSPPNGYLFLSNRPARIVLWGCVLLTAALIFLFSCQNGEQSSKTSGRIVRVVIEVAHPEYETLPKPQQRALWDSISFTVRKSAHFLEFAALGFFLRLLTASYGLRAGMLWAWLAATLYAATDELHQLISGERSGMWQDALLDSGGALTGVLVALAVLGVASLFLRRRSAT